MKIVYNAKPNPESDNTESHIAHALRELGCEVVSEGDGDVYLYHKSYAPPSQFKGKKAMWYFDKVQFRDRENSFLELASHADYVFLTDGSYAPKINGIVLRQGIGNELGFAPEKLELSEEIGFIGSMYGARNDFVQFMSANYRERFGIFDGYYGKDLQSLVTSLKIVVAPEYPTDDHYWSNRVYLTLGSGGFLIHPYAADLAKEYEEDKEIVFYRDRNELKEKIDHYLTHEAEREAIRKAGFRKTNEKYNFKERCRSLLAHLNTGIRG